MPLVPLTCWINSFSIWTMPVNSVFLYPDCWGHGLMGTQQLLCHFWQDWTILSSVLLGTDYFISACIHHSSMTFSIPPTCPPRQVPHTTPPWTSPPPWHFPPCGKQAPQTSIPHEAFLVWGALSGGDVQEELSGGNVLKMSLSHSPHIIHISHTGSCETGVCEHAQ